MDYKKYGLGCLKDKPDGRDFIYTASGAAAYPVGFMLEKFPVKNQQTVSSCVAHACALIKEIQEFYETGRKREFSVGWIYGYRLSGQYQGEGMYPREAMSNLLNYGDVLVADFPENLEIGNIKNLVTNRKTTCLNNGKKYKIKSYARVMSLSAVKSALFENYSPVMIVVDVYDSFYNTGNNGIVPEKSGSCIGSHAMVIVGWTQIGNTEYYVVQNSWGADWGDNGYCYIKPSASFITDMYTSVDKENVTLNFTDVSSGKHWAESAISKCVKAGLISGYTDGTFKPDNTITRAEICSMFAKMLDL